MKKMLAVALIITTFLSCKKQDSQADDLSLTKVTKTNKLPDTPELLEKSLRLEQISIITGEVFRDKNLQNEFRNLVIRIAVNFKKEDEAIYFKQIVDGAIYNTGRSFCEKFKLKYLEIFNSGNYFNASKFKTVTEKIKSHDVSLNYSRNNAKGEFSTKQVLVIGSNGNIYDDLFMLANGTQIYFPYSENFINSTEEPSLTYDRGYDIEDVIAYQFSNTQDTPFEVWTNEHYSQQHPVYVINEGPVDYLGDPILLGGPDLPPVPNPSPLPTPTPPPPVAQCYTLNYNTLSDFVDDRYVVSNSVPRINILENYRTWLGGGNYIAIYQIYTIPKDLSVDKDNGTLAVKDTSRLINDKDLKIKRKYAGNWGYEIGFLFNGDWRLLQFNNAMAIAYKGGWFTNGLGDINYSITAGLKYDPATSKWKPSFEGSISTSGKINLSGQWFLDGTDYISRRDMLSHVVGNAFSMGVATDIGEAHETYPWTLRKCGRVMYYFKDAICY
ncbi:MAG: hypothetical protein H7068_00385 [Pedobacter sp.]|nr:hypothetical protein [Chitinophagaceae bacterium]